METIEAIDADPEPPLFAQGKTTKLREAAKALGAAGDVDAALATEEKIGVASPVARSHREFVVQEVGDLLVRAGFLEEAKQVMHVIPQGAQDGLRRVVPRLSPGEGRRRQGGQSDGRFNLRHRLPRRSTGRVQLRRINELHGT